MFRHRLAQLARYAAGSPRSTRLPVEVTLEPTNHCNLRCRLCPRAEMTRPPGRMDLGLFRAVARDLRGGFELVNLYGFGEPFLHPELVEMVATLHGHHIGVSITSNGTQLDAALGTALAHAGLDQLVVSLDHAEPGTYATLRRGADLEHVAENVRAFAAAALRVRPGMRIVLSAVQTREVLDDLDRFVALAKRLGVHGTRFERLVNVTGEPGRTAQCTAATERTHYYLWRRLYVYWDGRAGVCPQYLHRGDEEPQVGDLGAERVAAVWNGPRLVGMRRRVPRGKSLMPLCAGSVLPAFPVTMCVGKGSMGDLPRTTRVPPLGGTALA